MSARRIPWGWLSAAGVALLAAVLAAPYFSADRYGQRIRDALEASLGRKVKIGKARFDLFPGPGFTIDNVEIGEDPAFGVDLFAFVETVDARLKLSSLWTRRIEWASLTLNNPSVNLVKSESGRWNFETLLNPKVVAALPKFEVRDYGRVNFRFGDTKSIYYIGNVELDAAARRDGSWDVQFSAEPARTDRAFPGFRQSLTGRGRWRQDQVSFEIALDKGTLSEISSIIFGRDVGVYGIVSSRVQLTGPPSDVRIAGRLQLQDLHRWDQAPMKGDGWPLEFHGRLDINSQRLEVESTTQSLGLTPITVRYRVADYLSKPRWAVGLSWNRFPAGPLVALARHLGAPLPDNLTLAGALDGAVSWSGEGALQGQVAFHDAEVSLPDSTPVRFEQATVVFDGDRIELQPARATTADSEARVDAAYRWSTQELDLNVSSDEMTVADIRSHSAGLLASLLDAMRAGVWKGSLRYRRGPDSEEGWSGQVQLSRSEIQLPGFAEPLRVRSATARLEGARLWVDKMTARIGAIDVQGDYRYEPGATRPHKIRIVIPDADAAEIERLLAPTLRRDQGFLARTLGFGRAEIPAWLAERFAEGTLQIGALTIADTELTGVRARIRQDGPRIEFSSAEARLENGGGYGRLRVDLQGRVPTYRIDFHADSVDFKGGKVDADGVIEASGTGTELLTGVRSEGSFIGRGFDFCKSATGCYRLESQRLRLTELQLQVGPDLFIGRGATQEDGRLLLQLSSGAKQMRISGPLAQLAVE